MTITVDATVYGTGVDGVQLTHAVARCSLCPYWHAAVLGVDAEAAVTNAALRHEDTLHADRRSFRRSLERHAR